MPRVDVEAEQVELDGDYGNTVDGLMATCPLCGHTVEVFGTGGPSARRAGVMLSEECPRGERNFYVVENEDGD